MKGALFQVMILVLLIKNGCFGAVDFVDPPNGSVLAGFEGTLNAATIQCNVTNTQGTQITTQWTLQNFRGNSMVTGIINAPAGLFEFSGLYENCLTVLNLTGELDKVTVFCGTGLEPKGANFTLKIYRPPNLRENYIVKLEENSENVPIDLRQQPAAFPAPTSFAWNKDGQPLTGHALTYSNVTFAAVTRQDAGNYAVSATNFVSGSTTKVVGTDTGGFSLDVIYGPSLTVGPTQYYVLLGNSISLVCGTGLDSNPPATVNWTAPDDSRTIMNNARYGVENGPDIVRLNISHTSLADTGMWMCDIRVLSENYIVNNGSLVLQDPTLIGAPLVNGIHLAVISPPGKPCPLSVEAIKATSIQVLWDPPSMADSPITYYLINVCNLNSSIDVGKVVANTTTNVTLFEVTSLLPGTNYELTVVAVSQGGDVIALSQPSDPVVNKTEVTVPSLICNAPVSANGVITVTWSYVHTGGLPLTNVTVYYTYKVGSTTSVPISVPVDSLESTSVSVPNLQVGLRYTFNITAENINGSSGILCGPALHLEDNGNIVGAVIGGVAGGLVALGIFVTFGILFLTWLLKRRDKVDVSDKDGAVYDYPDHVEYKPKKAESLVYEQPDSLQQYTTIYMELNENPAYGKPARGADIKLEDCPAYLEQRKDPSVALEECPAYGK